MSSRFSLTPLAFAIAVVGLPAFAAPVTIPAGPLSTALTQYAQQQGIHLSLDAKLTQGKTTRGLHGDVAVHDGLRALLSGTELEFWQVADGTYSLRSVPMTFLPAVEVTGIKPLAIVASAGDVTLPAVEVEAVPFRETATGPVRGFVAKRSATGNKTDTAITEIPQSISVMGATEMRDRGVRSLDDALAYMPGVVGNTYGSDQRGFSWASIRGFPSAYTPTFRDGLFLFGGSFTTPLIEMYGVERVELLRGPGSLMYGQADPGGIINAVSKTPQAGQLNEVMLELGNPQEVKVGMDVGGGNEQFLYRIVASAKDGETFRKSLNGEHTEINRVYVAPSLTWKISEQTKLTVLTDYLKHEVSNDGWPMPNYSVEGPYWTPYNGTDPKFDQMKSEQYSLGYQFNHQFNDAWQLDQQLRYLKMTVPDYGWTYGTGQNADGAIERMTGLQDEWSQQMMVDTRVSGTVATGDVLHKLVLGVDWLKAKLDVHAWYGAAHALDPLNPDFSTPIPRPDALTTDERNNVSQLGLYAQDQIYLGRWLISLGGRYDIAKKTLDNRLAGSNTTQRDTAVTGRAGLTYLFDSGAAPYLSYATSFKPEIGKDSAGEQFKPTEGKQWELGIKYAPVNQNMLLTAAVFDITKSNVLSDDPALLGLKKQTGEMRSRGLELEGKAELGQGWSATAQYSFTDVETTQGAANVLGKRPENIPKHTASTWIDYRWQGGTLAGLQLAAGLRYMGSTYGDADNTQAIPSYTTADLNISYPVKDWSLSLNVRNLFDREYVTTCYGQACYPGDPRRVTAGAAYHW